jgi:hypothetical protein
MKKALLIGINYLQTNISLNGCIDDIVNMNAVLKDVYKYDQITVLRDDIASPDTLPTRNNIMTALAKLIVDSVNCSEIWIHYSGHGARVRDLNGDEVSKLDSVLVPMDYIASGVIVDDDIYTIIQHSKCKTIILMDSCNSGTVVDLPWSYTIVNPKTYSRSLNNRYNLQNQQIYMFSGCKDNQTSAVTFSKQLGKYVGAFTFAFLTCLKNANYKTSLLLLYRDICVFLSNNRYSQIPVFSSSSSNPLASSATLSVPIPVAVITNPTTNVFKNILNTSIVPVPISVPTNNNNPNPITNILLNIPPNTNRNLLKIHFTA